MGRRIRNLFYGVGFQAPFSLQSLAAAGRSQALWQKFIRRAAKIELGAEELARQYEWWSLKSQPNAMKRTASDPDPRAGLVAVDFRAGMALLPFLPECPADIKLILRGFRRGRLVQFDKGDVGKLEKYAAAHASDFADLREALETLKREDKTYRDSLVDVTYHHIRLFGTKLRRLIMAGFRESWRVRNMTDERAASRLEKSGDLSLLFLLMDLASLATPALLLLAWPGRTWWQYPVWALPLFMPFIRRLWVRSGRVSE